MLVAAGNAAGQQPTPASSNITDGQSAAYQASVTQDGLKRDAVAIRAELIRVRDQMRQLLPGDVATVDNAIQQMDGLSREQMDRVIQALRGASRPEGLSGQAKALTDALKDQGAISASLKRLAVMLDARQSMENLGAELSALLLRQVAARDELARLARKDPTPDRLHNRDRERWEITNEDQKRIGEDINLLLGRLDRITQNLTGDAQGRFMKVAGAARDGKMTELVVTAAAKTAQGPFAEAATAQTSITSALVAMEQALADAKTPGERLAAMQSDLKKLVDEQKTVTQAIAGFREKQSVDDDMRRQQAMIGSKVSALQAEIQPLNNQAASELQAAHDAAEQA